MKRSLIMKLFIFSFFVLGLSLLATAPVMAGVCGDGHKDDGEVCDWGSNRSDVEPNACRTDCRAAGCGDGVIDNGEQCDDGQSSNHANTPPLKCRNGCKLPRCGDGIVDNGTRSNNPQHTYDEDCDDKNSLNDDGCLNSCKSCVMLGAVGNIEITDDTNICSGEVKLDDYGDYGTIIIKRSGITLNCNGAKISGEGRGVGIMIFRSNDVTIRNCEVYGYEVGIKGEDANNVTLTNNRLCGNSIADIELEDATQMSGQGNVCRKPGAWNDTGKQGCSQQISICNPPAVALGMTAKRFGNSAALKNMPQVTAQKNMTPVAPLAGKIKAGVKMAPAAVAPVQATTKKIKVMPKTRRVPVLPQK